MSSSSSAADRRPRSLRGLLVESLARLAHEAPGHHARMCDRLAGRVIDLDLDGDIFSLRGIGPRLQLGPAAGAACRLRAGTSVVAALLRGSTTLFDVVLDGRVAIHGPVDELLHFHEALLEYLHGAVRSPTFPELRDELFHLSDHRDSP